MAPLFLTYIWSRENMLLLSQQWKHEAACFVLLQADNTSHTLSAFHFLQCRLKNVPLLHLTPRAKGEGENLKFYKSTSSSPSNLSRGQKGHPPITHSLHTWSMQGKCGWKVPPGDKTSLVYLLFPELSNLYLCIPSGWVQGQGSQNCISATSFVSCSQMNQPFILKSKGPCHLLFCFWPLDFRQNQDRKYVTYSSYHIHNLRNQQTVTKQTKSKLRKRINKYKSRN